MHGCREACLQPAIDLLARGAGEPPLRVLHWLLHVRRRQDVHDAALACRQRWRRFVDGEGRHVLLQLHVTGIGHAGTVQAVQYRPRGVLEEQRGHHKEVLLLQVHLFKF